MDPSSESSPLIGTLGVEVIAKVPRKWYSSPIAPVGVRSFLTVFVPISTVHITVHVFPYTFWTSKLIILATFTSHLAVFHYFFQLLEGEMFAGLCGAYEKIVVTLVSQSAANLSTKGVGLQ